MGSTPVPAGGALPGRPVHSNPALRILHRLRRFARPRRGWSPAETRGEDRLRRANDELAAQVAERTRVEQELRGILESAPDAMVVVDADGRIEMVNAQLEVLFGRQRRDLLGETIETLVPERLRERHREHRRRYSGELMVRPMGAGMDLAGRRGDGTEFPVEISLSPIHTNRGVLVSAAIRDTTERKRQEALLRRTNEALEQRVAERTRELEARAEQLARSNAELEQFAYVVSHDLKSPMRGISSLAQWISEDHAEALDQEGRRHLQLLQERTQRMHHLIDGVLAFARATRENMRRTLDVETLVANVVDGLSPPDGISVEVEGPLPEVIYDEVQLIQVFQNLIGNAIRHMGRKVGRITVAARQTGDAWEFSVRDTGIGIPERHHARIFRMFQTLHGPGGERSTGIGLAIVKKIVESHGGRIWLECGLASGAEFRFTVSKTDAAARDLAGEGRRTGHGAECAHPARGG